MTRSAFQRLGTTGRDLYRALQTKAERGEQQMVFRNVPYERICEAYRALLDDHPEYFWLRGGSSATVRTGGTETTLFFKPTFHGGRMPPDLRSMRAALDKRVQAFVREARRAAADPYGQILFLHDALVRLCDYGEAPYAHNAYGCLMGRRAVCAGYALGMKLLCDMTGLRSCVVRGTAESVRGTEAHAWLAVRIDGRWYHLDPTWDDPVNENDNSQLTHAYFNLSTEWIGADHRDFTLPEGVTCNSTEAAYYIREGLFCGTGDWRAVIKENLSERLESMPFDVEFRFETGSLFDRAYESLMGGEINEIINELVREEGFPIERWRVASQAFNSMNSIRLIVSDYEE